MPEQEWKQLLRTGVPWERCEQWLEMPTRHPLAERLRDESAGIVEDASSMARLSLVQAAVGLSRDFPAQALGELAKVVPVFAASGLLREAMAARCEAAGHLLELGCPYEARSLLAPSQRDGPPMSPNASRAQKAKAACALLDLGLGTEALSAALDLVPDLAQSAALSSSRFLRRAMALVADVLLAHLLTRQTADTALADGMASARLKPPSKAGPEPGAVLDALRACLGATKVLEQDPELSSQELLTAALLNQDRLADRLSGFTDALKSDPGVTPGAWLRLSVAWRLHGSGSLALRCAREAERVAQSEGSLRWRRMALLEALQIQAESGSASGLADGWHELRRVEAAILCARSDFEEIRHWFELGPPASSPPQAAPPARNIRALHVQSALSALQAAPGKAWKVDALAASCGVSRRTLEQAFRLECNQSVAEVIREHRINRALALLRLTDHAIKRVAFESGFGSPSALCRELRLRFGQSPKEIRMSHQRQRG